MARIDAGGVFYSNPTESWEPTMHLAFFAVLESQPVDPLQVGPGMGVLMKQVSTKLLHQQWRSNIGRTVWRPVVEMDPNSPDNE